MSSCIYVGQVKHRRFTPVLHALNYRLFMMYVDLAELSDVFDPDWFWSARGPNIAWFRRQDHLGDPQQPLDEAVRDSVTAETGCRPAGPIRLLTHLRYFGFCFNPVSFYYCFDHSDTHVESIVAEVNNTPWGEQHCYVLDESLNDRGEPTKRYRLQKRFHVSPSMEMQWAYDRRFGTPARRLAVFMENCKGGQKIFDATLALERRPINHGSLASVLASHPFMTAKVVAAIYFQALRLWLKRTLFYEHPVKKRGAPSSTRT